MSVPIVALNLSNGLANARRVAGGIHMWRRSLKKNLPLSALFPELSAAV